MSLIKQKGRSDSTVRPLFSPHSLLQSFIQPFEQSSTAGAPRLSAGSATEAAADTSAGEEDASAPNGAFVRPIPTGAPPNRPMPPGMGGPAPVMPKIPPGMVRSPSSGQVPPQGPPALPNQPPPTTPPSTHYVVFF